MFRKATACSLVASLMLGACASQGFNNQTGGTVAGGALGALLGSQLGQGSGRSWAIAGGALLGALAGSSLGARLDERDQMLASGAAQRANTAPIGEKVFWSNPNSGNSGSYTPVREGRTNSGRYCRQYEQAIVVDGRTETATGQACQRSDGSWEIMS